MNPVFMVNLENGDAAVFIGKKLVMALDVTDRDDYGIVTVAQNIADALGVYLNYHAYPVPSHKDWIWTDIAVMLPVNQAESVETRSFSELATIHGWTEEQLKHAKANQMKFYGEESCLRMANGREIRINQNVDYIRVVQSGQELAILSKEMLNESSVALIKELFQQCGSSTG